MPPLGDAGKFSTDLEAAADPIVPVAALRDPAADKFAEQTLECIAHLGVVGRRCGKGAPVTVNEIAPVLLLDLA